MRIRRSSSHGASRPRHRMTPGPSTFQGNLHASPWSGSVSVGSRFGTISSQPNAPPSTKPFAVGWSTPMPWSRSSSPSRRREVIRPPRSGRATSSHRPAAILTLAMLAAAGCGASGQGAAKIHTLQTPVAAVQVSPPAVPTPSIAPPLSHVFVIVMENRSYAQALSGGYTAALAHKYAYATNYHGVTHPSLPNYLALTSGTTWGIADDGFHALPAGGLGAQLSNANVTWRAYMEGMGKDRK